MEREERLEYCERLWELCLNGESWVYPQILATLSIIDTHFSGRIKDEESKKRIIRNELIEAIDELLNPRSERNCNKEMSIGLDWKKSLVKLLNEGKL